MPADGFFSTVVQDREPFYRRRAGIIERLREGIFVRRTDTTARVIAPQASFPFLGLDALPQRGSRSRGRHPFSRGFRLAVCTTNTWSRGLTHWLSSPRPSPSSSEESQKRRSLIPHSLRNPFGIQALFRGYVEGEVNSDARTLEVRMADSAMREVSERWGLGMRSVAVIAGNVCGIGMCAVGGVSWRRGRTEDWR